MEDSFRERPARAVMLGRGRKVPRALVATQRLQGKRRCAIVHFTPPRNRRSNGLGQPSGLPELGTSDPLANARDALRRKKEIKDELPNSWPEVEVESLPDFNGNVINDPNIIKLIEDAKSLGTPSFTLRDPTGKTMEFRGPFI